MKLKLSLSRLFLTILILAAPAFAGPEDRQKPGDSLDRMLQEGWKPVAPGVLQLNRGAHRVETFAIGPEGMRWGLRQMRSHLRFLENEYQTYPSADLLRTIQSLRQEIIKLKHDMEGVVTEEEPLAEAIEKSGCGTSYSASAEASSQSSTQGVGATASAKFENTCTLTGVPDTYSYAYSRATRGTLTETLTQEDPQTGSWIQSFSTASVPGGPDCYARAYSYARYTAGNIFVTAEDENTLCPGIVGPSEVVVGATTGCLSVTWNLSAPGGIPPYSYTWSVDGTQVGTDASYTRQVCDGDGNFTLRATVTDSTPTADQIPQHATQILAVKVLPPLTLAPIAGDSNVAFTSPSAACVSKTWSTSAADGTLPYSYTWKVNGVQAGTGTSYTKSICHTDTSFTLTASVTDSSTPTPQSAMQTLVVAVISPLTLDPITGPTSVSFNSPSAACVLKTWSALASNGNSPYTYKWSIGGTQVGTGASFTGQVCPSYPNFTLTATVTDSSTPTPQNATQTIGVTISVPAALTLAAITGENTVSFASSSAACVSKTWSTSASNGNPPYSYKWSIGGTQVGTGTSYTRQVCPSHASFTLTATVTDSTTPTAQTATRNRTVTISVTSLALAAISGDNSVSFASSSAACVSKTWSTSASGGTSPYSYKWSVGGTQVGTGTSYTRQVCPSHASFTLTATVTDSTTPTAQTDTRSRAVAIFVTPSPTPPTVTIAGPEDVFFLRSTASCSTQTWTSAVSGGVSPYTYQWKIGVTVVGTGSSYSRSVCPSHAGFTLTLTVTASDGQVGSDTHGVAVSVSSPTDPCTLDKAISPTQPCI